MVVPTFNRNEYSFERWNHNGSRSSKTFYTLTDLMKINNSFCISFSVIPFKTLFGSFNASLPNENKSKQQDSSWMPFILIMCVSKEEMFFCFFLSLHMMHIYCDNVSLYYCGSCLVICIFVSYSWFFGAHFIPDDYDRCLKLCVCVGCNESLRNYYESAKIENEQQIYFKNLCAQRHRTIQKHEARNKWLHEIETLPIQDAIRTAQKHKRINNKRAEIS